MKWFKHLVDAQLDEMLRDLKEKYGWSGYGRWWAVVEAVAEQMRPSSNRCHLELSCKGWCDLLDGMPKKIVPFLIFLAEHKTSTITIEFLEPDGTPIEPSKSFQNDYKMILKSFHNTFKIILRIPKLLKLRDTRNANKPIVGTIEVEVDVDKEKYKKEKPKKSKKGTPVKMPKEVVKAWDNFELKKLPEPKWEEYARRKGVTVDLFPIFEDFCTHHKKKGSVWVSWYAAWQKWIQNAQKWNPEYFEVQKNKQTFDEKKKALTEHNKKMLTWAVGKDRTYDDILKGYELYEVKAKDMFYGSYMSLSQVIEYYESQRGKLDG